MSRIFYKAILIVFLFILGGKNLSAQIARIVDVNASRVLYDAKRNLIYAAARSYDINYGNKLVSIDPESGQVVNSVFVGSDPSCMELTKDTNFIYVGLSGASQVKRVNLNTFSVDMTVSLGNGSYGPLYAEDLTTLVAGPQYVVVSRMSKSVSPRHSGVAVFKNGVQLSQVTASHTGSNVIEADDSVNVVYGYNNETTEYGFRRMRVDTTTGISVLDLVQGAGFGSNFEYHEGLIYSESGKVFDPRSNPPAAVGQFNAPYYYKKKVEADKHNNKVYITDYYSSLEIVVFNLSTYSSIETVNLQQYMPTGMQNPDVFDMIRYGVNGLALIVREQYTTEEDGVIILFESCIPRKSADLKIFPLLQSQGYNILDTVQIKYALTNLGLETARNVTLTDSVPGSLPLISYNTSHGSLSVQSGVLTLTLDSLIPGDTTVITLGVLKSTPDTIENKIEVTSNTFECNTSDNITTNDLTFEAEDLDIGFIVRPNSAFVTLGDTITWEYKIKTIGERPAMNIQFVDTLHPSLTLIDASASIGNLTINGNRVTCDLSFLDINEFFSVYISFKASTIDTVKNLAYVTVDYPDNFQGNNIASNYVLIVPNSVLEYTRPDFKMYPNPVNVNTSFTIHSESRIEKVCIYAPTGQLLSALYTSDKLFRLLLDTEGFSKGVYIVEVIGGKGAVRKKLIIK